MSEGKPSASEVLERLAARRAAGRNLFWSHCKACRCKMKVQRDGLMEEIRQEGPLCCDCGQSRGIDSASYGGSPQSRVDHAYHGGRYHSAEWEG